jgi:transcriptional regulator with XRE-family HTH domain
MMREFMRGFGTKKSTLMQLDRERREILGQRLRSLRMMNGLSQRRLGEIIGVSDKTVYYWEHGRKSMRKIYVMVLAHLFKVDEEYLYDPNYKKKRSSFNDDLEDFIRSLDRDKRERLHQILTQQ